MRLLLVEDDKGIRSTLTRKLRAECFAVDAASDGAEGSYMARTNPYDVVILDNVLPKKTGLMVCDDIRKTGRTMPILILSVLGDTRQKIDLITAGADDYIVKPFSFDELVVRIRALMRRPQQIENEVFTLDGLVIDTRQQSVKRGNKHYYLTRKEFMLLEYLLRNRGNVMSRSMIMEHVWDMASDPFSNTIESHILSIRRKLGGKNGKRLIQTVPGRGYKIDTF